MDAVSEQPMRVEEYLNTCRCLDSENLDELVKTDETLDKLIQTEEFRNQLLDTSEPEGNNSGIKVYHQIVLFDPENKEKNRTIDYFFVQKTPEGDNLLLLVNMYSKTGNKKTRSKKRKDKRKSLEKGYNLIKQICSVTGRIPNYGIARQLYVLSDESLSLHETYKPQIQQTSQPTKTKEGNKPTEPKPPQKLFIFKKPAPTRKRPRNKRRAPIPKGNLDQHTAANNLDYQRCKTWLENHCVEYGHESEMVLDFPDLRNALRCARIFAKEDQKVQIYREVRPCEYYVVSYVALNQTQRGVDVFLIEPHTLRRKKNDSYNRALDMTRLTAEHMTHELGLIIRTRTHRLLYYTEEEEEEEENKCDHHKITVIRK